jgi:hypothetical protein
MIEMLAVPGWKTAPTTLEAWLEAFQKATQAEVHYRRDPPEGVWIELNSIRLRGYAIMAGPNVEVINFELTAPDPADALKVLETAALSVEWEIYPDDDEDGESDSEPEEDEDDSE